VMSFQSPCMDDAVLSESSLNIPTLPYSNTAVVITVSFPWYDTQIHSYVLRL
jgi:hypothetical protein